MFFVIDSNEFIFAFGPLKESSACELLDKLIEKGDLHTIRIPRTILEEVRRNLSPEAFQEFIEFTNVLTTIDEDVVVPFELAFKYEIIGFKLADAFIAAYTEWVGAEFLITENRHFLDRYSDLPFKILTAAECLTLI